MAKEKKKDKTDFNDMAGEQGLGAVAETIDQAVSSALPPDPPEGVMPVFDLDTVLSRYYMSIPDGKVWDAQLEQLMRVAQARSVFGPALYKEWENSSKRQSIQSSLCYQKISAAQASGDRGLEDAIDRYVYLINTDECYDTHKGERVKLSNLKYTIPLHFERWRDSPKRREIFRDGIVFDPSGKNTKKGMINTFQGLPLKPINPGKPHERKCAAILDLIDDLCGKDDEVRHWFLCWLAYPLQNIGSKMASALLLHGETQGAGKSILFEEVMRKIYGEYSATLGQHELESPYNDWSSELLFGLFEEVLSRNEKHNQIGTIKHMITGKTKRVNKKFISGWEESNFMNAVFLSNEHQPLPIEPDDRRLFVLWISKKLDEELKQKVLDEIYGDGVEAFYGFLMNYKTADFSTHTEPPITSAKEAIIEFGRPSWDAFYQDWSKERLKVPYDTCGVEQLYASYVSWAKAGNERAPVSLRKFASFIKRRERHRNDIRYGFEMKASFFILGSPDEKENQQEYFKRMYEKFETALCGMQRSIEAKE